MSDNINTMNFKQLKNEVQSLRDELAIMKRKYEDIIYNLDTDNFSQRVVKQGKDMYTKIEQNAESISLQAEKTNENSSNLAKLTITAKEIQSEVKALADEDTKLSTKIDQTAESIATNVSAINEEFKKYSTTEQTANQISASVTKYVTDTLADADYVTNAELQITADGIRSTVTSNYNSLSGDIDNVWTYASSIEQTTNKIQTKVSSAVLGKYDTNGKYTIYTQTNDTFHFDGEYMRINSAIIMTDNAGNDAFSIFHDESSNSVSGGTFYLWGKGTHSYGPVVIGNKNSSGTQPIYLYSVNNDNLIATQGWVLENTGGVGTNYAIFG